MTAAEIKDEVVRRLSLSIDELVGQSPEDIPANYRLIGEQSALCGILEFIQKGLKK